MTKQAEALARDFHPDKAVEEEIRVQALMSSPASTTRWKSPRNCSNAAS